VRKKKESSALVVQPSIWSAFNLSEAFFLAHALVTVERLGILDSLKKPMTAKKLATQYRVDLHVLDATLQMLALRTQLVSYVSGKYGVTSSYDWGARFSLLQYVGSYGPNAQALTRILRDPSIGGELVDREQHKRAFERATPLDRNPLGGLVIQLGLNRVLDIGCGTASMLLYLASNREDFLGWGIDNNSWMCAEARRRVASARKSRSVKILSGDSREMDNVLPSRITKKVEVLTASGVANEFFSDGISLAVAWLARLKAAFPGRTMLISDYYGQLGFKKQPVWAGVALHDYVSVLSGQGVPPPDLAGWKKVYRAARCELIQTVEEENSCNFIHVLRL
jgi:SAM-dependent methyltransferase